MFESILIAYDDSPPSRLALEAALALGAPEASALAAHVVAPPVIELPGGARDQPPPGVELGELAVRAWRERLDGLAAGRSASPRLEVAVEVGRPADALLALAEARRCDLVAAGSRGVGGLGRLLLGTVSHRLLRDAPCSVLLARGEDRAAGEAGPVVVGLDGSQPAERALARAQAAAVAHGTALVLVHVADWHLPFATGDASAYEAVRRELRRHGEAVLGEARDRVAAPLDTVVEDLRQGHVAAELVAACAEHRAELAVVGAHGLGAVGALLGGTAWRMVNEAPCPVLVAR